jgi:hypothetical protein
MLQMQHRYAYNGAKVVPCLCHHVVFRCSLRIADLLSVAVACWTAAAVVKEIVIG